MKPSAPSRCPFLNVIAYIDLRTLSPVLILGFLISLSDRVVNTRFHLVKLRRL